MASMSMSPSAGAGSPPGSALSLPKRGRGSRGGRMGSRRGAGSGGGPGSRGGRGGAGAGGRKKRESTIASESAANTPAAAMGTPGGLSTIMSPAQQQQREGSMLSNSRRSVTTRQGGAGTVNGGQQGEGGEEMDEDFDDEADDELALLLGDDEYDEQAKERSEAKEALRLLLDQFSPDQFERYGVYRSAGFQKAAIRRLVNHVLQQTCSPNIVIGVRGLAKVFVGEIVESARQIQADAGRQGPVHPDDLREAYRKYQGTANKKGSQRAKLFVR